MGCYKLEKRVWKCWRGGKCYQKCQIVSALVTIKQWRRNWIVSRSSRLTTHVFLATKKQTRRSLIVMLPIFRSSHKEKHCGSHEPRELTSDSWSVCHMHAPNFLLTPISVLILLSVIFFPCSLGSVFILLYLYIWIFMFECIWW